MTSFEQLGLSEPILKSINELGFESPTKIQSKAIPSLLEGYRDFIGLAQTGTGKTAAFGLPLLQLVNPDVPHTQALILAPTRELCQQISGQMELFGKHLNNVNILPVYGGAPIAGQIKALKKTVHILIATPGRLIDLVNRKAVRLEGIGYVVLDEADEMLNMGFKEELDQILMHTPKEKVVWLFSATMPKEIRRIVHEYMVSPVEVKVDQEEKINSNIEHQYVLVRRADKVEALTRFIDREPDIRAVVFCRTKMDTQELADELMRRRYPADAIHGDMTQKQRDRVMQRFRSGDLTLLIATDVAARGIDVSDVSHVFHYTIPDDVAWYTHRSGRTARAGSSGISVNFVQNRDLSRLEQFARALDIRFTQTSIPSPEEVGYTRMQTWALGILEKKTKHIDPEIMDRLQLLFANLSKEELLAKVVKAELDKLNIATGPDLNKGDFGPGKNKSKRTGDRKPGNFRRRKKNPKRSTPTGSFHKKSKKKRR